MYQKLNANLKWKLKDKTKQENSMKTRREKYFNEMETIYLQ